MIKRDFLKTEMIRAGYKFNDQHSVDVYNNDYIIVTVTDLSVHITPMNDHIPQFECELQAKLLTTELILKVCAIYTEIVCTALIKN